MAGAETGPLDPEAFAVALRPLADGDGAVLLAVSGGPDSSALMHAAAAWAGGRGGPPLNVATVDHRLRPSSREEAEAVGVAAAALGLSHVILPWADAPVAGKASQAAARTARYRLLVERAQEIGADRLVTAHTLDDQAETVLMRLAAGSGLSGLGAMRVAARRGPVLHLRPFLHIPKSRLVATCRAHNWPCCDEPSNRDRRFARARWRVLEPALAAEGLDASRLATLAGRVQRADAALATAAREARERCRLPDRDGEAVIDMRRLLRGEPEEVALRVLADVLPVTEGRPPLARLERCLAALQQADAMGTTLRRTLCGRQLTLRRDGLLLVAPEPPRRRGRR